MRPLILLALVTGALGVIYHTSEEVQAIMNSPGVREQFPHVDPWPWSKVEDPYNESQSIDSVFEKRAYFAFKLKSEKLQRRVLLIQEMSKQKEDISNDNPLNKSFVPAHQLELRLAGFYYDEVEQGDRFNATFKEVARTLCDAFPRYLMFTRFVVDYGLIRGRLQETDIDEQPIKKILSKHGFAYRANSDIASGEYSGFVAVREHASLKVTGMHELRAAAKIFLQKPLRTSVYVDTLYACIESPTGSCEEIASMKIGNCDAKKMRSLLLLMIVNIALGERYLEVRKGKYGVLAETDDLFDDRQSIDSILEKKAYIAFKLKNEKLERRVRLLQEMSSEHTSGYGIFSGYKSHLNSSFVPSSELELRLAGFYYDEAEHRDRINITLTVVARTLCRSIPTILTFDRFVLNSNMIIGRMQEMEIDEQPIKQILTKTGFTHLADGHTSDISSGDNNGFVAVRHHPSLRDKSLKELTDAAKIFLQKPLRASAFVDTVYACIESSTGACEEIASKKMERCAWEEL